MINLGSFTPLIILIFLAALVFLGIRWFSNWKIVRRGYLMLSVYGVILLVSVVIYYFIPVSAEETERSGNGHPGHYEIFGSVLSGAEDVSSIEEFRLEDWEFPFEDETLRIESYGGMHHDMRILAEHTQNDVIEATMYRTPLYFNGREIEIDSIPVNVQLDSDRLNLTFQEDTEEVRFASFTKEFPMQQFDDTEQELDGFGFGMAITWSEQLLYLQVPEDIEISTGSGVQLEFIN
jgi:hypothetical protein